MTQVSFEFFPAGTDQGTQTLVDTAAALAEAFHPRFVSVTYGAGGTTQDRTLRSVRELSARLRVPIAGHLTCTGASIAQTHAVLDQYLDTGVSHVVALRGDQQVGSVSPHQVGYETAADLVAGIRARPDGGKLKIFVAAYPEVHPLAKSASDDLENLKRKLDAGADEAITQFFFDPDVFMSFLDRARSANIEAPIVPGLMPIANFDNLRRFAATCGTRIPQWLTDLMAGTHDDPQLRQMLAASVIAQQCQQLEAAGVEKFHLYTMNRQPLTATACHILGLNQR